MLNVTRLENASSDVSTNESIAIQPRLCHLRKTPDCSSYGFNLHAIKGMVGHFIGLVDINSPAETAGLKRGDRILQVNGQSVSWDSHNQVVARIREYVDFVEFLVVAPVTEDLLPDLAPPAHECTDSEPVPDETSALLPSNKKPDPRKVSKNRKPVLDITKKAK